MRVTMWKLNENNPPQNSVCDTESHNCCTPQPKGKVPCPNCSQNAKGVLGKTLEHLLNEEAKRKLTCFDGFHFCTTATCEIIYFRDNEILVQKDLSVTVGCKDGASPATVCYCFHWTKEKIKAQLETNGVTSALEDIKEKMKSIGCSCEILNPSGECCLGDVAKAIKEADR